MELILELTLELGLELGFELLASVWDTRELFTHTPYVCVLSYISVEFGRGGEGRNRAKNGRCMNTQRALCPKLRQVPGRLPQSGVEVGRRTVRRLRRGRHPGVAPDRGVPAYTSAPCLVV